MQKIVFDFDRISSEKDFYKLAATQMNLPDYFGANADALWDMITGYIALPVEVEFIHVSLPQLEKFEDIISLFEEAADELGDNFVFHYSLKKHA